MQAALQKASPSDIVQLSAEATQLEGLDALFGQPDSSGTSSSDSLLSSLFQTPGNTASTDPLASLEQALASAPASSTGSTGSTTAGTTGSTTASSSSTPSLASALATYESSLQSQETQSLFGVDQTAGSLFG